MSTGEINEEISKGASNSIQLSTGELDGKLRRMEHQISIDITEMLHQLPSNDHMPKSCISRVHLQLRAVNEKAYDPVLVSIGPYHYERRKSDLQSMERHKLRYLSDLMKRREKKDGICEADQLHEYVNILGELEDRARGYYEEVVTLEKDAFIKMLLVDAFFIIELLQRGSWRRYKVERETDPLFMAHWMIGRLKRDLILAENQIPFFVMERLYLIIGDISDPLAFIFLAVNNLPIYRCSCRAMRQDEYAIAMRSIVDLCSDPFVKLQPSTLRSRKLDRSKLEGFKHILDLTRKFMLIEEILEMKEESMSQPQESKETTTTPTPADLKKYTYSAMELRDLGVEFTSVENRKFYEIRFKNGVLEIPVFHIADGTETYLRNLIAWEEHGHCRDETFYIGSYMSFIDGLIDTAKDVELLRHHGIIDSLMGDDEEIATIFNNMGKHVTLKSNYYYGKIVQELTDHCRKRRHVWMAKLKRNHLNSPWTILSVIAAILLLILTVTQTVYSVLSYYKA